MRIKTFKKSDIKAAVNEDTDENSPLVLIEAGKWEDGGKYQYQENVLKETATGLFYNFCLSRAGSYFTEYILNFEWLEDKIELIEVAKTTKVIEVWTVVKNS